MNINFARLNRRRHSLRFGFLFGIAIGGFGGFAVLFRLLLFRIVLRLLFRFGNGRHNRLLGFIFLGGNSFLDFLAHTVSFNGLGKVEFCGDFHRGVGIRAHGDDAHFTQRRFLDVIERSLNGLAVHGTAGFHQFALFYVRADRELPVGSGLALRDDIGGVLAVRNNFAGDFQRIVFNARRHHPDTGVGLVFMVGQERHTCRNLHSAQIHHHRIFPAGQIHFAARIGESDHLRLRTHGGFNQGKFTHP
ncbi:hypothetical protein SDC9_88448 [bioreactor metagenome]|uniref:Uncharacterized protein n=1 Tax=bioreactor metagenome TaxID=1076179 RepID=A0A644ZLL3_9ZZZZ